MKYNQWLSEWLENYVKPTSKMRTYVRYREIVNQHISLPLGGYDLDKLTPIVLQRFTTDLLEHGNLKTGEGLSANSVNSIVTVLQISLRSAFVSGQISDYSGDKIRRPKVCEKKVTCFTVEEQKLIETKILYGNKPRLFGVILSLYTGMRLGEVLALQWSDVDFINGVIRVTKSCHDCIDGEGHYIRCIDTPKTKNSIRDIPLPDRLAPYLRELKKNSRSPFVVASGRGEKFISVRAYQRSFEVLLKSLSIPHKGFHSLRHTFATRALECGMDVKTLSEIMGHKNATVTLNRYAHSLLPHKKQMMNKVGKLL